jgi:acyl carrier protein
LYLPVEDVKPNREFMDLGLDSIISIEWIRAINRRFGTALVASVVHEHRNIAALAAMLASTVLASSPAPDLACPATAVQAPGSLDDLLLRVQRGDLAVAQAEGMLDELA